jgi:SAM-dependent methyltransferase
MKTTNLLNRCLSRFGLRLTHIIGPTEPYKNAFDLDSSQADDLSAESKRLLNLVAYTKTNSSSYNAELYNSGYHSIEIDGKKFKGQRDPDERLKDIPFNFAGTTVLDLGCNQGGMLRAVAKQIKNGVGIDYDSKMVNVSNRICRHKNFPNLDYYVFDLEREDLQILRNFLTTERVDIVFLLSVCMWITNWQRVIDLAISLSDKLLFESYGQQADQEAYLRSKYRELITVRDSSPDDPGQQKRKLFLCKN